MGGTETRGYFGARDALKVLGLWKVGEKRFFSSFCLDPPSVTARAAFVALALASSLAMITVATRRARRA